MTQGKIEKLAHNYFLAKSFIIEMGYEHELEWVESLSIDNLEESDLLREVAWVILSSGMKETVIRNLFNDISSAFLNWSSAKAIALNKENCRQIALNSFSNQSKIDAILYFADNLSEMGFEKFVIRIKQNGLDFITTFPYLGPVTSIHLAKNIGYDVVKPDRHLVRISNQCGFTNPEEMCRNLSSLIEERISTIDSVLWRFASLNKNYISLF